MNDFRIAIPTYKRYIELGEKTLNTLEKYNIDKSIIDIFVNNQFEYDIYKPLYPDYNLIIGETGMKEIREFIFNYYEEGDKIVCMDDDITDIKEKIDDKTLINIRELDLEIEKGFDLCKEHNTILWGIYPCDNKMMMKNIVSTHLMFCVGWMFGVIIDKECLSLSISQYEDYERSIKVFKKYNKVIRLNYICAKTKYNNNTGGMCDNNRANIMKRDLEILKNSYGDYIRIQDKKDSLLGVNPRMKSNIGKIKKS